VKKCRGGKFLKTWEKDRDGKIGFKIFLPQHFLLGDTRGGGWFNFRNGTSLKQGKPVEKEPVRLKKGHWRRKVGAHVSKATVSLSTSGDRGSIEGGVRGEGGMFYQRVLCHRLRRKRVRPLLMRKRSRGGREKDSD